jgi:hypothetical protein
MIMMPYADLSHHCSSQARQTSGTPQGRGADAAVGGRDDRCRVDHAAG